MRTYNQPTAGQTADQVLRAAIAVDEALIGALYVTDSEGAPTDPGTLAALQRATSWQTQAIAAAEAVALDLKSASLGSASYTMAERIRGGLTLPAGGGLCVDSYRVLRLAGLLPAGGVSSHG